MKLSRWRGGDQPPLSPERQAAIDVLCGRRATPVVVKPKSRALPTQASIKRLVAGVRAAGLEVSGVTADGTVLTGKPSETLAAREQTGVGTSWDDV